MEFSSTFGSNVNMHFIPEFPGFRHFVSRMLDFIHGRRAWMGLRLKPVDIQVAAGKLKKGFDEKMWNDLVGDSKFWDQEKADKWRKEKMQQQFLINPGLVHVDATGVNSKGLLIEKDILGLRNYGPQETNELGSTSSLSLNSLSLSPL